MNIRIHAFAPQGHQTSIHDPLKTGLGIVLALAVPSMASAIVVIPGVGVGAIADAPAGGALCGDGNSGAPLNITFEVPDLSGSPIANVEVSMTFSPAHTFVGDITARLIDPGQTRNHVLFGRTGATTAGACGDNSDLMGPYTFTDTAVPPVGGFWQEAVVVGSAVPLASGDYFTTNSGGAGAVNPMPPTNLQAVFGGMSAIEAQGTWTLRIVDSGDSDLGGVAGASLILVLGPSDIIFAYGFEPIPVN